MKSTKYILLTAVLSICLCVSAVDFGTYGSVYQTSSVRLNSFGGGGQSYGTTGTEFRSTSGMIPSGSAYSYGAYSAPSYTPYRKRNTFCSAEDNLLTADHNLNINLQPDPSYGISGRRRILGNGNGEYDGEFNGNQMWDDEEGEWVDIPVGKTKTENGNTYRWNGTAWEIIGEQGDPNIPVGPVPWLFLLLLSGTYILCHKRKQA